VFNQAMVLSNLTGIVFGLLFFAVRGVYARRLAADATTAALGIQYLTWFVPALFLQFPLVIMGAALRAMGDMKLPTVIQVATVLLNIGLAPVLMFGWDTGRPLGVAGAAIASLVAIGVGCVAFILYFLRPASPLRFESAEWTPRPRLWGAMLRIGLPAGGEFALMAVYMVLVYDIIRPFGAAAQAGFGIGIRVVQALFLPTVAIAFAAAPVAGQNFGAGLGARVSSTPTPAWSRSDRSTCASPAGTSSPPGSSSSARASSRAWATRCPRWRRPPCACCSSRCRPTRSPTSPGSSSGRCGTSRWPRSRSSSW
jgi:Na+-driven multidrug efflux pump